MNLRCVLTHETVMTLFSFDEDVITSSLFLEMLKNDAVPYLSNNNHILQLDGAPVYVGHIVRDFLNLGVNGGVVL